VTVQPGALLSADGEGIIKNGASVKVGNDKAIDTNVIENPVPEDPVKTEIKPGDGKAVQVGDEINYSITYENYEKDVSTITVTDVLDEGLDFVEAAPAKCATYDAKTRTVTWVIPNVPARQGGAVTLTVKVNGKATANDSKVRNTAGVQVGDDPAFMTNIVENPAKVPPANGRKTRTGDNSIGLLAALVCVVSGSLLLASRRRRKTSADR
jgi:fimbrial isopeptide formation D2 family protein